jgi:hypothetical protein
VLSNPLLFQLQLRPKIQDITSCLRLLSDEMLNWVVVTLSEQRIRHIFDNSKAGQKSLRVKVEYMLDNNVLVCLEKLH